MSKREGAASLSFYQEQGYLPQALRNYLMRLGWSHGDQEIFSLKEMIELFDMNALSSSAAAINPEKLDWLNAHYINEMPVEDSAKQFVSKLEDLGWDVATGADYMLVLPLLRERHKTILAMAQGAQFLYCDELVLDESKMRKQLTQDNKTLFEMLLLKLEVLETWDEEHLKQVIDSVLSEANVKMGQLGKPLRFVLTADAPSPNLALTLEWIGKQRSLSRIRSAILKCGD